VWRRTPKVSRAPGSSRWPVSKRLGRFFRARSRSISVRLVPKSLPQEQPLPAGDLLTFRRRRPDSALFSNLLRLFRAHPVHFTAAPRSAALPRQRRCCERLLNPERDSWALSLLLSNAPRVCSVWVGPFRPVVFCVRSLLMAEVPDLPGRSAGLIPGQPNHLPGCPRPPGGSLEFEIPLSLNCISGSRVCGSTRQACRFALDSVYCPNESTPWSNLPGRVRSSCIRPGSARRRCGLCSPWPSVRTG